MPAVATIAVSFNLTGQNATSTRIELVNASSTPVYTFVTDTTLRAPGSQTINVSTAGLTGMADGNYTIKVTVMNSTLGQMREASSAVRAFDMAAPSTFTPTNTNTFTATNTHTYTNTPTHTSTFTYTPTPTATSKVLEVTDLLPYPNPYDPIAQPFLRIKVKVTQKDVESLSVRIYSSAQRLIDEKVFEGQALTQILSGDCIYYQSETLKNLSNGTYYYVIMVTKDGKEVRSKIDKVIILKSKSK